MPIKLPFSYSTVHSQADFRKDPSRRRWRNAAEPAPGRLGVPSWLHLYKVCAILSNDKVRF